MNNQDQAAQVIALCAQKGYGPYLTAGVNPHNHIYLKTGDDRFTLIPHEWKPLAEFLLDAAKNQKEE